MTKATRVAHNERRNKRRNERNERKAFKALATKCYFDMCDMPPAVLDVALAHAGAMHDEWLQEYRRTAADPLAPRMRPIDDGTLVNINVPSSEIHPERLDGNAISFLFVLSVIRHVGYRAAPSESDIVLIASVIHEFWLIENPASIGGPLDVHFRRLPQVEQKKDIDIVMMGMSATAGYLA
jgi:hypothetical protein